MADLRTAGISVQNMAVGDSVNFDGATVQVTSVSASGTNYNGAGYATVVLNDANTTTITLSDNDTICSHFSPSGPSSTVATWSQTKQA